MDRDEAQFGPYGEFGEKAPGWYNEGGVLPSGMVREQISAPRQQVLKTTVFVGGKEWPVPTPEERRQARRIWLHGQLFEARAQVDGLEAMLEALDAEELE